MAISRGYDIYTDDRDPSIQEVVDEGKKAKGWYEDKRTPFPLPHP